jgi:GT2 family glycosyltransferase
MSRKQKHQSKPKPILDVVITTGGRFDMLSKCLEALYREAENNPIAIYLVDNASPAEEYRDNSEMFSKREDSNVCDWKVKHFSQEVGFPASNNEGARMGSAPLIMFLNDDVELQDGSIKEIVKTLDDPTIGVVGIKLLFPLSSTSPIRPAGKVQHIGMALNIRGDIEHPLVGWTQDNPKTKISREVVSVTGACLTIRRSLFNKVGGFSLEYGMGTWEDVDLCFKVRQLGQRIWVNCDALGHHYVGATQEKKNRGYPLQQNRMVFQTKWGNSGLMSWSDWIFR